MLQSTQRSGLLYALVHSAFLSTLLSGPLSGLLLSSLLPKLLRTADIRSNSREIFDSDTVSVTFPVQKNGELFQRGQLGERTRASIVFHILLYDECSNKCTVNTVKKVNGKLITSTATMRMMAYLRAAAATLGPDRLGFGPNRQCWISNGDVPVRVHNTWHHDYSQDSGSHRPSWNTSVNRSKNSVKECRS